MHGGDNREVASFQSVFINAVFVACVFISKFFICFMLH